MTLRILGGNAPNTNANTDAAINMAQKCSVKLAAAMHGAAMPFMRLKHNPGYSLETAAANAQNSLEELNKILSVIHRLIGQFNRLQDASGAESDALAHVIGGIIRSLPGKKVITLFDPRRTDEFFDKLWKNPALSAEPGELKNRAAEALALLYGAEERTLRVIASNQKIVTGAAVEQQNINAAGKASLQQLRKLRLTYIGTFNA